MPYRPLGCALMPGKGAMLEVVLVVIAVVFDPPNGGQSL